MANFELTPFSESSPCGKIVSSPAEVEQRLLELSPDLTPELLYRVVVGGLGARNETTSASAPTAPGLKQWLQTVEVARTELSEKGWQIHDERNCPFVSSADSTISVVVMTGDIETGRQGTLDPTNSAEKGAVAGGYVSKNSQLELFNQSAIELAQAKKGETQVWAFLYHYDRKLNEVRYELSYPIGFDGKKITKWGERLILGSVPNSPQDYVDNKPKPIAPTMVDVEPKTGTF